MADISPDTRPETSPATDPDGFNHSTHVTPLAEALTGINLSIDEKVYGQAARLNVTSTLLNSPAMATLLAAHRNAVIDDVLGHARHVITQHLATAEKWRYDRVCWAFAIMLGEIPADTPEPLSPADEAENARRAQATATTKGTHAMTEHTETRTPTRSEVDNSYAERYVVVGSDTDGTTIVLETVTNPEEWPERLAHWRNPANSAPYNHDVHMSREVIKVEYRRMDDGAHRWL